MQIPSHIDGCGVVVSFGWMHISDPFMMMTTKLPRKACSGVNCEEYGFQSNLMMIMVFCDDEGANKGRILCLLFMKGVFGWCGKQKEEDFNEPCLEVI